MSEYVVFTEEFLHSFYDPATCSYMVPLSGKAAHDMKMLRDENATLKAENAKLRELANDGVSERIKSVYLVMVADDLLEDGTPLCAYLDVPSAERRASREKCVDEDGVRHYAWVTEVKVVGE